MDRPAPTADGVHERSRVGVWLRALRPDQWVKNAVVFVALVFGLRLLDPSAVAASLAAFLVFCAASSAVYLLNDIADLERDRAHPEKRRRPIAAGEISVRAAGTAAGLLVPSSLLVAFLVQPALALVVAAYLGLNVAYSLGLRQVMFVDVLAISLGFVLRAVAGAAAISVEISTWLVVCTFMVMLFLALGKRRAEVAASESAGLTRPVNQSYRVDLLDQLITVVVAATIMSYCLYTLSPDVRQRFGVNHLEVTVPFVVYGLFRYLYLVRHTDRAQNPTRAVVTDRPIAIATLLWGGVVLALLYARAIG